ncbi:MAG TPA: hypothetical protein VHM00_19065 [Caldimonas sp.]|nr:hypothetical protein [Caldimonas sp.]HEX2543170.1 hypothetical protein [Caldimonas sp.]
MAILLAGAGAAGAAEVIPITWDAAQRFQLTSSVAAGKFVEVCGRLPRGALVRWSFESAAPLDFNIHFHQGKKVVVPAKRDGAATASGTLLARVAQDYCWMWTQRGSVDTLLTLTLQRTRR